MLITLKDRVSVSPRTTPPKVSNPVESSPSAAPMGSANPSSATVNVGVSGSLDIISRTAVWLPGDVGENVTPTSINPAAGINALFVSMEN